MQNQVRRRTSRSMGLTVQLGLVGRVALAVTAGLALILASGVPMAEAATRPVVASVSPSSGPTVGGSSVTITGTGFTGATRVRFGSRTAPGFTVHGDSRITVTALPGGAGTVNVVVVTPGGASRANPNARFTYVRPPAPVVATVSPSSGPTVGGSSVTITGSGFAGATRVRFGLRAATGFTVHSDTRITATTPAGAGAGTVNVRVVTPGGTSRIGPAAKFTYVASSGSDYASNLELIRSQAVRNRNTDASPWRSTPSAQLVPQNHYGPRSEYLGNPGGNPEQAFPVEAGGQFRVACEFSHFAYDDPLVHPNQPGAAHLHMFFGNTDLNAYSTSDSILNSGGSTCNGGELNRTGYWVPAMFDGAGNVRIPERIVVYYKGLGLANGRAEPFPDGAAMLATTNLNTVSDWYGGAIGQMTFICSDNYSGSSSPAGDTIPNCDGSIYGVGHQRVVLEMNVKFPQCWNGRDPSNPANYRHPTAGSWYYSNCEGEFNRTLVNMEYFVNYVVEVGETTADWYLSSDVNPTTRTRGSAPAGSTVHADWWTGWHRETNQMFLDNCVNFRTSEPSGCGFGYLTNGGPDGNNPYPGPALKMRQQFTGPSKVPSADLHRQLCPGGGNLSGAAAAYCRPGSAVMRTSLAEGGGVFCTAHPGMVPARPTDDAGA